MSEMVTLVCPEGAFDYPIAHGTREYYPRRLDTSAEYPAREFDGPWVVDVPIEVYHHFLGRAGFYVYEPPKPPGVTPSEPAAEPEAAPIDAALDQLAEGVAEQGERVEALVVDAIATAEVADDSGGEVRQRTRVPRR